MNAFELKQMQKITDVEKKNWDLLSVQGAMSNPNLAILGQIQKHAPELVSSFEYEDGKLSSLNRDFSFALAVISKYPEKFVNWDKKSTDFLRGQFDLLCKELSFGAETYNQSKERWAQAAEQIRNSGKVDKSFADKFYRLATTVNPTLTGRKVKNLLDLSKNKNEHIDFGLIGTGGISMRKYGNDGKGNCHDEDGFSLSYQTFRNVDVANASPINVVPTRVLTDGKVFVEENKYINMENANTVYSGDSPAPYLDLISGVLTVGKGEIIKPYMRKSVKDQKVTPNDTQLGYVDAQLTRTTQQAKIITDKFFEPQR